MCSWKAIPVTGSSFWFGSLGKDDEPSTLFIFGPVHPVVLFSFSGMIFLGPPKLARAKGTRSRLRRDEPASRSPAGGFCSDANCRLVGIPT